MTRRKLQAAIFRNRHRRSGPKLYISVVQYSCRHICYVSTYVLHDIPGKQLYFQSLGERKNRLFVFRQVMQAFSLQNYFEMIMYSRSLIIRVSIPMIHTKLIINSCLPLQLLAIRDFLNHKQIQLGIRMFFLDLAVPIIKDLLQ